MTEQLDKLRSSVGPLESEIIDAYASGSLSRRGFLVRGSVVGLSTAFTGAVIGITLLNLTYFIAYLCYFPTLPFFIKALDGRESEIGLAIAISSLKIGRAHV
mgnify:CR=1 FL=1